MRQRQSAKAARFRESVIREMTRLVNARPGGGVNLAQGFPDFACPPELKAAAKAAIDADVNQYAITWGHKDTRAAIARKFGRWFGGFAVDPEREITVCCGATETMIATCLAIVDPGDEIIVFEPFYENYGPDAILSGATPIFVRLSPPSFAIPWAELEKAFARKPRAIVINTPNNPTGKVFTREELSRIAKLCIEHDVIAITDEIYEHMVYEGEHVVLATLPGMRERTVTINALSKTYSVTGWRVGWAIAPPDITNAIRKVHDFLTVGSPAPLQKAAIAALELPDAYYANLREEYRVRRDLLCDGLERVGFRCTRPNGAYYVMSDFSSFGFDGDDEAFARHLIDTTGVAGVPGSSFFSNPRDGRTLIRFCFPKRHATLEDAVKRLEKLR